MKNLFDKYGRRVLREAPEGWRVMDGCLTQCPGTEWYSNYKTIKSGERKSALVLTDEALFEYYQQF